MSIKFVTEPPARGADRVKHGNECWKLIGGEPDVIMDVNTTP